MRLPLLLSLALAAPMTAAVMQFAQPVPCSVIVYRDYDFYFYYHPTFRLTSACEDGAVLQLRKVSQATVADRTRPLNVWPTSGTWFVSYHGDTAPSRFKLTAWTDKWQYRANTNDLWKDAVTK